MQERKRVAIDNDFLSHLLEIKKHPDLPGLISSFFEALSVFPVMHPLVFEREAKVFPNKTRDVLFDRGIISSENLIDILKAQNGGEQYYSMMVRDIYRQFKGKDFPCNNPMTDWVAGQSLGEVHTVVMCAFLLYDCFLSDDGDAACKLQGIVNRRLNWKINIYSRRDRCELLRTKDKANRRGLTSKDLNMLSHSR